MSKNISIKEGGTAKTFSDVAKLRTELVGSGSCTWVPEDETQLVDKRITANGEYSPASDDAYGYGVVTVDIDLPSKSISDNGTYYASADNKEGWSQVTVNVPNAAQGTDTSGNDYSISADDFGNTTLSTEDSDYSVTVEKDPETGEEEVTLTNIARIYFAGSKTYLDGEQFDHTDFPVYAVVGDNEPQDITSQCGYSLPDGTSLHAEDQNALAASWTYNGRTYIARTTISVTASGTGEFELHYRINYYIYGPHYEYGWCTGNAVAPLKYVLFKWPHTEPERSGQWILKGFLANPSDNPVRHNVSPFTVNTVYAHSYLISPDVQEYVDQMSTVNVPVFIVENEEMADAAINAFVQGGSFSGGGHEF